MEIAITDSRENALLSVFICHLILFKIFLTHKNHLTKLSTICRI